MELTSIMLRTVLMYLFVFIVLRLMGKREIGKLSVIDLVISIMIAEIAVISIESTERSLWVTIGPIAVLVLIQLAISFVSLKSRRLRLLFDGQPSVIIRQGNLNWEEMRRQRYNLDDLLAQLRENKLDNISQVELAVLESSGKLSVLPRENPIADESGGSFASEDKAIYAKDDPKPKVRYELLPLPLIMDGKVQEASLEKLGKNRLWLMQELRQHGVRNVQSVFFCSVDHKGNLFIDRKN